MRRLLIPSLVLFAALGATSAHAEDITYTFQGFFATYLFAPNAPNQSNGYSLSDFTIQVIGNTNNIVNDGNGIYTNVGFASFIYESGNYFATLTTPVNVYEDVPLGIYGVQVTEGPGVQGSDILDITSPALPPPFNLAESGTVAGNTYFEYNNPLDISVGGGPGATQEVIQLTGIDSGGYYTAACSSGDSDSSSCSVDVPRTGNGGGQNGIPGLTPTPEPSTLVMFGSGILGLFGMARRRVAVISAH